MEIRRVKYIMYDMINHFGQYLINTIVSNIPSSYVRMKIYKIFYDIGENTNILMHVKFLGRRISIGDNVVINQNVILDGRGNLLKIENNVDISESVHIWTLTHDTSSSYHSVIKKTTVIENRVWIASRVTILPGVTISNGAVVGSGSVVTKEVKSFTVVAGNPIKVIGKRNPDLCYINNYFPWFM